ncbi:Domain of unknown function DUF551 [uncultured Caudovirales phage]|uniref:DUF551 domain-containing protein n=1 Tax=uncultured Caudovirales phage TaxID=2100421 RepID=A0A6J5MC18_9CAUD|nr:Domain of unknown function DUF551 [uncultured Caudovirales phage]
MKTPEQIAEKYAETVWDESELPPEDRAIERHVTIGKISAKMGFIAGYKAAQDQFRSTLGGAGDKLTPTGWISVKERLPDNTEPVVGMDHKGLYYIICRSHMTSFGWTHAYSFEYANGITHWMPLPKVSRFGKPLPEAPKGEG